MLTESFTKIIRHIPRQVTAEEEQEMKSLKGNRQANNEKDEPKIVYDIEEDTIVNEKRLQILTSITFRDLFQKKVKILEMRKRELFSQSLVYMDYDLVKIINIKTKSLLVG